MWCNLGQGPNWYVYCDDAIRDDDETVGLNWCDPETGNILSYLKPNSSKFSQGESGKPKSVQDTKAESGNRGVIYI